MGRKEPVILFASRDTVWSRHLRVRLRQRGARVLTAGTAKELLDRVSDSFPDLILLDEDLDDVGLGSLTALIRNRHPGLKIAAVTSRPSLAAEQIWRSLGILSCHTKSSKSATLLKFIEEVFREALDTAPSEETRVPRILCVDDDPLYLRSLNRILTNHGYRVATFDNPEHAAESIPEISPDLAILDIRMPGMDGLLLAEEIREDHRGRIPVVLLSALGSDDDIAEGYRRGASYYITKPCAPKSVLNIVDYFVGNLDAAEREALESQL